MRKESLDRPWVRDQQSYTYPSVAMPGFCIRVWRTDGVTEPPSHIDIDRMVHLPLSKHQISHLRNYNPLGASSTFDVAVETMPVVPEVPEGTSEAVVALRSAR